MQSNENECFAAFAAKGDLKALGRVFDSVAPTLMGLARHMARDCDTEDLVQSTFLTAIEKADRYDPQRGVEPWLLGILANHARQARAKNARQPDPDRVAVGAHDDPAITAQEQELSAAFDKALAELSKERREVVELRMRGMTSREIASHLDEPQGTIRARLSRAMAALRGRMPRAYQAAFGIAALDLSAIRANILELAAAKSLATTASVSPWIFGAIEMKRSAVLAVLILGVLTSLTSWGLVSGFGSADIDPMMPESGSGSAHAGVAAVDRSESTSNGSAAPARTELDASVDRDRNDSRQVILGGRCVYKDSKLPAVGMEIQIEPIPRSARDLALFGSSTWSVDRPVRTDATGAFQVVARFPESGVLLRIEGEGLATHEDYWSQPEFRRGRAVDAGTIELEPGARVKGRVINELGQPIRLTSLQLSYGEELVLDEKGRFDCGRLPLGRHPVTIRPPDGHILRPHHLDLSDPSQEVEVQVVVRSFASLQGRVVDTEGRAVPGLRITLTVPSLDNSTTEISDERGGFRFGSWDNALREANLQIDAHPYRVVTGAGACRLGDDVRVVVDRGLTMDVRARLRATGEPVEQYCVITYPRGDEDTIPRRQAGGRHREGVATIDGVWPGRYDIEIIPFDRNLATARLVDVQVPHRGEPPVALLDEREPFTIQVLDERDEGISDAQVELIRVTGAEGIPSLKMVIDKRHFSEPPRQPTVFDTERIDTGVTNESGAVSLFCRPEAHPLVVRVSGAGIFEQSFRVPADAKSLACRIARAGRVSGTAAPLSIVRIFRSLGFTPVETAGEKNAKKAQSRHVRIRLDGSFDLPRIEAGTWDVSLGTPIVPWGKAIMRIEIAPGENKQLTVDGSAIATGRLEGHLGIPADFPHASIEAIPTSEENFGLGRIRADFGADRRYSFDALPPGQYRIWVRFHGFDNALTSSLGGDSNVVIAAGKTTHADLEFPRQHLEIELVDENGKPRPHEFAHCWVGRTKGGGIFSGYIVSDEHGVFHVPHAPEGSLILNPRAQKNAKIEKATPWSPPRARMQVRIPR